MTESNFNIDKWYVNYDKRFAFSVSSDFDALDENNEKLIVESVEEQSLAINDFSNQLSQVLNKTKITNDGSVELDLDDRIITFIADQSGSMTWNDNNNYRYEIMKSMIQQIGANYPGDIKYNLIIYGATFINVLFFGIFEEEDLDIVNTETLSKLYFAQSESNFSGMRVVRNTDHYPTSPLDGETIVDGFVTQIFDDDLTENQKYYYTVYVYDKNYRFSDGINISVTPRLRVVPRGVSIFRSWIDSDIFGEGNSFLGSGVIRDDNTIGLWHCDESKENVIYDFSDSELNLEFDSNPQWFDKVFVPAGTSGIRFNGEDTKAYQNSTDKLSINFGSNEGFTFMGWVYLYALPSSHYVILERSSSSFRNYDVRINNNGKIVFRNDSSTEHISTTSLELNKWQYIAVTYDPDYNITSATPGYISFFINGIEAGNINVIPSDIGTNPTSSLDFTIGSNRNDTNFLYGKLTELSIHNIDRNQSYIQNQVTVQNVINSTTNGPLYDASGNVVTEAIGITGDNGDRLVVIRYDVPVDFNFQGGEISIIKNTKKVPSWEEDGKVIKLHSNVSAGYYYATDADDFVQGEKYYYRIYSKNTNENYSSSSDSPFLEFDIPKGGLIFWPDLDPSLMAPTDPEFGQLITPGNQKIYLRWKNNFSSDNRIKKIKIYYSPTGYPTFNYLGNCNGELVFTGDSNEEKFIHRYIENNKQTFYTIFNIDKYGRSSTSYLTTMNIPSLEANEETIPLLNVENLYYELLDRTSIGLKWETPIQDVRGNEINATFDQTVIIYASITDTFGRPVPKETLVDLNISAQINRVSVIDDVFGIIETTNFPDSDAYSFSISGPENGIIKAVLSITNNLSILSQLNSATFDVRLKSFIYDEKTDQNIFTYWSNNIKINFTNPWKVELINRDKKRVSQRCYYVRTSVFSKVDKLLTNYPSFNGIYIRSSTPFVARAKLTYKGEPIESGSIDIAVWDASMDLCKCAGAAADEQCKYKGEKIEVSKTITNVPSRLTVVPGTEEQEDEFGNTIEVPISYVDIPINAPQMPQGIRLFIKGTHSGYSLTDDMYIVFQNILNIDINANAPIVDGADIVEDQSLSYIIDPDYPNDQSLITYPDDFTIVQWGLLSIEVEGNISRKLYSIDNVSLSNGVFSYTRNGMARNVFMGPIDSENIEILETWQITASVIYKGLTSFARQFIYIENKPNQLNYFNARFLIEVDYHYKNAIGNKLITNGEDYIKVYISRNPNTSETRVSNVFRTCANEEDAPLIELSSGQIVFVDTGDPDLQIVWGEVSEIYDEYTGKNILAVGEDGHVDQQSAYIQLEDEDDSDITFFYIRANKFISFRNEGGCKRDSDCQKGLRINLRCLDLTGCDIPGGEVFLNGSTTSFVNGEPLVLTGGGNMNSGVPPCPICFTEPLRIQTIWKKIDGIEVNDFTQNASVSIRPDSRIEIRVEISYADRPVPNGTPVYIVIDDNSGLTLFIAERNIVSTFIDENINKSYADITIIATREPTETTLETASIITTYSPPPDTSYDAKKYEIPKVKREKRIGYGLEIVHEDIIFEDSSSSSSSATLTEKYQNPDIFSKTIERYDIKDNQWSYLIAMTENKGDVFAAEINNYIYIIGGLRNNDQVISYLTEEYNIIDDLTEIKENMPTPRFGGMTITIGNIIYTIGGVEFDSKNNILATSSKIEAYNTSNNSWEILENMPIINVGELDEKIYGVAFGTAEHVVLSDGSNEKNYIYVLSGLTRIVPSSAGVSLDDYNNRVLRYCVEDNEWTYSRILYDFELETYQRISPLSIQYNNKIIVFNGSLFVNEQNIYPKEVYNIEMQLDLSNIEINTGGDNFSKVPLSKYESTIVKYSNDVNPSGENDKYYIIGGFNNDSPALDILEKIDTTSVPFSYENSIDNSLSPLPIGKNGTKAVLSIVDDASLGLKSYIYVIGGYTQGRGSDFVDIEFDI